MDLSGYRHIGSITVTDANSPRFGIHHYYVSPAGKRAFRSGGPYPAGMIFIGKIYGIVEEGGGLNEGPLRFITYMRKDDAARDTGGWVYALFGPHRNQIVADVKKGCFDCHTKVEAADYVFSKPLM